MLFRRRQIPTRIERLRVAVWPRNSWSRSTKYFGKRVLRLTATPHAIAIGFAAGAFASCTPLVGFHFLTAFGLAWVLRGNLIAAALGTSIGNPITFPFIWAFTFKIGQWILHGRAPKADPAHVHQQFQHGLFEKSLDSLWPMLKPMFIGGVPLGLVIGSVSYVIVYKSVEVYQRRRKRILAERGEQLFPAPGRTLEEDGGA
ncbi:DUF2062 domain-containing protein [Roseibium porphyridii]|uniref:DUF2062 domain-containing protein n=1 Tax=Roseibium porphyridii TaxID=2866279 RepID=A0ABY8F6A4_9HYPH|nr:MULTISPECIES: DUF2062 domain-containing protein [Stappiaceae]QFT32914.1 hypothetical protein FIV00_20655 [Labrenzia sp. THAF82]WFE88218.1 DUF2062 domain-containing protein [Roseibium sp. KMA01]